MDEDEEAGDQEPGLRASSTIMELLRDKKSGVKTAEKERLDAEAAARRRIRARAAAFKKKLSTRPARRLARLEDYNAAVAEHARLLATGVDAGPAPVREPDSESDMSAHSDEEAALKPTAAVTQMQEEDEIPDTLDGGPSISGGAIGPQVYISEGGQLVLDEASLSVAQETEQLDTTVIDRDTLNTRVTSRSFTNQPPTTAWKPEQRRLFFRLLGQFGTDFAMIGQYFPRKTRQQVKMLYKRELKTRPQLVQLALENRLEIEEEEVERVRSKFKEINNITIDQETQSTVDALQANNDGNGDVDDDATQPEAAPAPAENKRGRKKEKKEQVAEVTAPVQVKRTFYHDEFDDDIPDTV
jgi:hypothetical protein